MKGTWATAAHFIELLFLTQPKCARLSAFFTVIPVSVDMFYSEQSAVSVNPTHFNVKYEYWHLLTLTDSFPQCQHGDKTCSACVKKIHKRYTAVNDGCNSCLFQSKSSIFCTGTIDFYLLILWCFELWTKKVTIPWLTLSVPVTSVQGQLCPSWIRNSL